MFATLLSITPSLIAQTGDELITAVVYQELDKVKQLVEAGVVANGDLIVVTFGEPIGTSGGTNTMKIVKVGEARRP